MEIVFDQVWSFAELCVSMAFAITYTRYEEKLRDTCSICYFSLECLYTFAFTLFYSFLQRTQSQQDSSTPPPPPPPPPRPTILQKIFRKLATNMVKSLGMALVGIYSLILWKIVDSSVNSCSVYRLCLTKWWSCFLLSQALSWLIMLLLLINSFVLCVCGGDYRLA